MVLHLEYLQEDLRWCLYFGPRLRSQDERWFLFFFSPGFRFCTSTHRIILPHVIFFLNAVTSDCFPILAFEVPELSF